MIWLPEKRIALPRRQRGFLLNPYRFGSAPPPSPWVPTDYTGIKIWNDADTSSSLVLATSLVDRWNDLTSNSIDLDGGSGSTRPTLVSAALNGRAVIRFAGSQRMFWNANNASGHDIAAAQALFKNKAGGFMATVHKVDPTDASATSRTLIYWATASRGFTRAGHYAGISGGTANAPAIVGRRLDADSGQIVSDPTSGRGTSWIIAISIFDWANSNAELWVNGTLVASSSSFQTDGSTSNTNSIDAYLGSGTDGGGTLINLFRGDLAALVVGDELLSSTNRQKIEGYWAHRFGLTANLPGGHPYVGSPP